MGHYAAEMELDKKLTWEEENECLKKQKEHDAKITSLILDSFQYIGKNGGRNIGKNNINESKIK